MESKTADELRIEELQKELHKLESRQGPKKTREQELKEFDQKLQMIVPQSEPEVLYEYHLKKAAEFKIKKMMKSSMNSNAVACTAEPDEDVDKYPLWMEDDIYYSNQGNTSLCIRHALAKALLWYWTAKFGKKHPMKLRNMIAFLVQLQPEGVKAASGCTVEHFSNVKGLIMDDDCRHVYELEIMVKEYYIGNIWCLDLGKMWKGYKEKTYHAVYQDFGTYTSQAKGIRNSWGSFRDPISQSDAEKGLHSRYDVKIESLTYKTDKEGDIPIIWDVGYDIYNKWHRGEDYIEDGESHLNKLMDIFSYNIDRETGDLIEGPIYIGDGGI